jgi:membrane-associated phospholipid phosphatase
MAVWFSVVYLGHHYVVDVLGGIAFAAIAYSIAAKNQHFSRWARRLSGFRVSRVREV